MFKRESVNLDLVSIVAEGLFSNLSFGLISFALPLYARHIGLSLAQIGILASLSSAVSMTLKPIIGRAADRFGLKRTYIAAILVRSLVSLFYGFAVFPWELYAIRSAHGLSMSLRDPSANALIAEHGGEKSIASAFAWYQTAKSAAGSISKALAGVILALTASRYSTIFMLAFVMSILPLLVVSIFVKEVKITGTAPLGVQDPQLQSLPTPRLSTKRMIVKCTGFAFLVSGTAEMLSGLFPVLATEYAGLSDAQAGLVYTVSMIVMIFSGPLFGYLSDHVSRKLVLVVRSLANTLSSIAYAAAPTFLGVGVAKTVDDMGKAAFRPAWGSLMAQVANYDKNSRAQTIGWLSMGEDAGKVCAPALAGFLWNTWGIAALMGTRILLAIITEVYALSVTPWQDQLPAARAPADRPHPKEVRIQRSTSIVT